MKVRCVDPECNVLLQKADAQKCSSFLGSSAVDRLLGTQINTCTTDFSTSFSRGTISCPHYGASTPGNAHLLFSTHALSHHDEEVLAACTSGNVYTDSYGPHYVKEEQQWVI